MDPAAVVENTKSGLEKVKSGLEVARSIVISGAVLLLSLALVVVLGDSFREQRPVLRPVHVPESLAKLGITAESLTAMIANRVAELQREAELTNQFSGPRQQGADKAGPQNANSVVTDGADPLEKLTLPGTDASLQMLVTLVSKFIGTSPPTIDVSIWEDQGRFAFTLQYSGATLPKSTDLADLSGVHRFGVNAQEINRGSVEAIAERVLWLIDPTSYARLLLADGGNISFVPSYYRRPDIYTEEALRQSNERMAFELLIHCTDGGCPNKIDRARAWSEMGSLAYSLNENVQAAAYFSKAFETSGFKPRTIDRLNFARALLAVDRPIDALGRLRSLNGAKDYGKIPPYSNWLDSSWSVVDEFENYWDFSTVRELVALQTSAYARLLNLRQAQEIQETARRATFEEAATNTLLNLSIATEAWTLLHPPTGTAPRLQDVDILGALLVLSDWASIDSAMAQLVRQGESDRDALEARRRQWQDVRGLKHSGADRTPDFLARWSGLDLRYSSNRERQLVLLDNLAETSNDDISRIAIRKVEAVLLRRLIADVLRPEIGERLNQTVGALIAYLLLQDGNTFSPRRTIFALSGKLSELSLWRIDPNAAHPDLAASLEILNSLMVAANVAAGQMGTSPLSSVGDLDFERAVSASHRMCNVLLPEIVLASSLIPQGTAGEVAFMNLGLGVPTYVPWEKENWFKSAFCDSDVIDTPARRSSMEISRAISLVAQAETLRDPDQARQRREMALESLVATSESIGSPLRVVILLSLGRNDDALAITESWQQARYPEVDILQAGLRGRVLMQNKMVDEAIRVLTESLDSVEVFYWGIDDFRPDILTEALIAQGKDVDAIKWIKLVLSEIEVYTPFQLDPADQRASRYGRLLATKIEILCKTQQNEAAKSAFERGAGRFKLIPAGLGRATKCWQ